MPRHATHASSSPGPAGAPKGAGPHAHGHVYPPSLPHSHSHPHSHPAKHQSHRTIRFALGLSILTLLLIPLVSVSSWVVRCYLGGACSSRSWVPLPSCLLASLDLPPAGSDRAKALGVREEEPLKWHNFLRSAVHMPMPAQRHDPAQATVAEAYPADQWQPWDLPKNILHNFPNPENARLDPSLFHLHIKFLTFDRVNTSIRCLNSLIHADYEGDSVSLEVFLDHPFHLVEGWRKQNVSMQQEALRRRREMLQVLDALSWPHGPKKLVARSLNAGIQPQWMEAFWPENVNEFAFIVEDDTEVSPLFYTYLKRLVMHYYYTKSNFNSHVYGISFQRQWFVPATEGNKLVAPPQPFQYQLVGTWGQIVFPIPWKDFRVWYDISRYTPGLEPILDNMVTTKFWFKKGNSIWTHWQVHWTYVRHMFNLYTGFPGNLSLSVCHRTAGVNIKHTLGPDTEMITKDVLHGTALPENAERDPRTGLPSWWSEMPASESMKIFDFCFRELPNWRTPVTSFPDLHKVLHIFNATKELAVVVIPDSTAFAYKLVRNFLCHLDGTGLHNYLLLFTLHPLKDPSGADCVQAAQNNAGMLEMAADLAERNHLVFVQTELVTSSSTECVDASTGDSLFMSRIQASLVQNLLDAGISVLVSGVGALWRVNPFSCFREAASRHRISALSRLLKSPPPSIELGGGAADTGSGASFAGSLVWVEGSPKGAKKWQAFQGLWEKHHVRNTTGLPAEAAEDALKLFHGLAMKAPPALSRMQTKECVVAAPWKSSPQSPNSTSPAIVLAPLEDSTARLRRFGLWNLHDTYSSCTSIRCSPYV